MASSSRVFRFDVIPGRIQTPVAPSPRSFHWKTVVGMAIYGGMLSAAAFALHCLAVR